MPKIKRGEVWYADLGETRGSEQHGMRPVVIIQNDTGNTFSPTTIVASITDGLKRWMPTHVKVEPTRGIYKTSTVLLEQVKTIDKRRLVDKVAVLTEEQMKQVDEAIMISFGLIPVPTREEAMSGLAGGRG